MIMFMNRQTGIQEVYKFFQPTHRIHQSIARKNRFLYANISSRHTQMSEIWFWIIALVPAVLGLLAIIPAGDLSDLKNMRRFLIEQTKG